MVVAVNRQARTLQMPQSLTPAHCSSRPAGTQHSKTNHMTFANAAEQRNPYPMTSMLDAETVKASNPEKCRSDNDSEKSHGLSKTAFNEAACQSRETEDDNFVPTTRARALPESTGQPTAQPPDWSSVPEINIESATQLTWSNPEARRPHSRRTSNRPRTAVPSTNTSPTSSRKEQRPNFLRKAKSFLKRSDSKVDVMAEQHVPITRVENDRAPEAECNAPLKIKSTGLHIFSLSPHTSGSNSPSSPLTPSSTFYESTGESNDEHFDSRKNSNSIAGANLNDHPRTGITWAPSASDYGMPVPRSQRRRSLSMEQKSKSHSAFQHNHAREEEEELVEGHLQASFSARAARGVGLKAHRLSLTLPENFVVPTRSLEKQYKSTKLLHAKGRLVGRGSTAKVTTMCRRDGSREDLYAVKEFRARNKNESEFEYAQLIKSEYTVANSINHPNIVRTFDLCLDKRQRYNTVMEFCPIELYSLVEKGLFRSYYDEKARLCFFKQILRAVGYLHDNGIAHRDIKLENILMNADGHLKLTDFGVSEVFCGEHPGTRSSGGRCGQNMGENRLCSPGVCGSYPYISPEVMARTDAYDPSKLDVWSCGVLWITLSFSGNLWDMPVENSSEYFAKFMNGWRSWLSEHPDCVPNEETGYPKCGAFMGKIGSLAMKKLILKLMHPNPDLRFTIQEALDSSVIKCAECCAPDGLENDPCMIDASKRSQPRAMTKLFKHNHLPPREHKIPKAFKHRFDMGDGYS